MTLSGNRAQFLTLVAIQLAMCLTTSTVSAEPPSTPEWRLYLGSGANWLAKQYEFRKTDYGLRPGYRLGASLTLPESRYIVAEIGAFLDRRAGRESYDTAYGSMGVDVRPERWTREVELTYIVVNPLSLRLNVPIKFSCPYIKVGALIGFLVSATTHLDRVGNDYRYTSEWDVTEYAESVDKSLMISTGVDYRLGNFKLFTETGFLHSFSDLKGDQGRTCAPDSGLGDSRIRGLLFEVGVRI